ncbi:hypothetical protein SGLAM104S_04409 [Streptomyces glaucescens]
MTTAAAFESVTDELTFVFGPLLATALCTAVDPAAGLVTEASLTLVGGLLFAAQKSTQPTVTAAAGHARVEHVSALRVPGVRVLIVAFLGIGAVFGGMQVSLAAFSESIGEPGLNGVLYGVFAAGNMISGMVCGAIAWKVAPQRRLVVGYGALALAAAGLWAAHSVLVLAGLGLLVGMCIAPALITGYTLVEDLVPAGARTEAFAGLTGAVALGQAGGRHGRRTAGGPLLGRRRFPGAAGRHGARPGDPAGTAFAARGAAPRPDRRAWRGSPLAGDSGLIRWNTSLWTVVCTH